MYYGNEQAKALYLQAALDMFRAKSEENYIPRYRLEELATKFKDGLLEDDKEEAMIFFDEECELTFRMDHVRVPNQLSYSSSGSDSVT